jgi:hypothetical protein
VSGGKGEQKPVFSIVELKTTALEYGIPGISQTLLPLLFGMMLAISMIPYLFLYLSLRDKRAGAPASSRLHEFAAKPFRQLTAWVHAHRHPQLLHH